MVGDKERTSLFQLLRLLSPLQQGPPPVHAAAQEHLAAPPVRRAVGVVVARRAVGVVVAVSLSEKR